MDSELEVVNGDVERPKKLWFEWIVPVFLRPRSTLAKITAYEGATWLTPMLLLTVLFLARTLIAGWLQQSAGAMPAELPPNFEYFTPEQQAQFQQTMAMQQGPLFRYVFPSLGTLISLWLVWFLLGSILHLILTLSGSRSSNRAALNLAAWASLPLALRAVLQIGAMLVTRQPILQPGLSGFITPGEGLVGFFGSLLALVDIYLVWQLILLMIGSVFISGLSRRKAGLSAFSAVIIVLLLQAIPGWIASQANGVNTIRPFFF